MGEELGPCSSKSAVTLSTDGELAEDAEQGSEGNSMSWGTFQSLCCRTPQAAFVFS